MGTQVGTLLPVIIGIPVLTCGNSVGEPKNEVGTRWDEVGTHALSTVLEMENPRTGTSRIGGVRTDRNQKSADPARHVFLLANELRSPV